MGGTNPYIEKADVELPTKSYSLTFIFPDKTEKKVEVQPDRIPYGPTGLPGSILDIAMGNGIELEHVCGGVCACSTCHVMVKKKGWIHVMKAQMMSSTSWMRPQSQHYSHDSDASACPTGRRKWLWKFLPSIRIWRRKGTNNQ